LTASFGAEKTTLIFALSVEMKKEIIKILPVIFSLLLSACPGKKDSSTSMFSFDQTQEAYDTVFEANEQLKQIKKLFKENESRQDDLKTALEAKDAVKVKEIAEELAYQINTGTKLGNEAIEKIEKVQEMNVNEDFKYYLNLKVESLRKYIEAFEERRKLAILLHDSYDPKNTKQRDFFVQEFKKGDENFKRILEEAQASSEKANALAKEVLSKKPENYKRNQPP
jgi:hypothetical protein